MPPKWRRGEAHWCRQIGDGFGTQSISPQVTIGGGFAGLCTAVRSAELGLRTAVLEAGTDENYP